MRKIDFDKLNEMITFTKYLQDKISENIESFRDDIKEEPSNCLWANCYRASFSQYRKLLAKELIKLERYIYGK